MSDRPRYLRPGWLILGALTLGFGGWWAYPRLRAALDRPATAPATAGGDEPATLTLPAADDTLSRPPAGTRVRVQVVNATTVRGLGRRAMFYLRDRGFDVVEVGTTRDRRDSTLVLDRSGHPEWARRAAHAMGGTRVEARPDSSRYLDVTVLVGRDWRPPAEPFHP